MGGNLRTVSRNKRAIAIFWLTQWGTFAAFALFLLGLLYLPAERTGTDVKFACFFFAVLGLPWVYVLLFRCRTVKEIEYGNDSLIVHCGKFEYRYRWGEVKEVRLSLERAISVIVRKDCSDVKTKTFVGVDPREVRDIVAEMNTYVRASREPRTEVQSDGQN